eukprot:g2700.t1
MGKGKKWAGEDTRGLKAKAQKKQSRLEKEAAANKLKQDAIDKSWQVGSDIRGQTKKQAAAEKAQQLAARRALKAQIEAEENEMIAKAKKPRGKARKAQKAKQSAELLFADYKKQKKSKFGKPKKKKKTSTVPKLVPNLNHVRAEEERQGTYNASGLDSALGALDLATNAGEKPVDAHPERRRKAAFKAFESRRLVELKVERPGLRLQQYKQLIFKEFQKSPENPMNQ